MFLIKIPHHVSLPQVSRRTHYDSSEWVRARQAKKVSRINLLSGAEGESFNKAEKYFRTLENILKEFLIRSSSAGWEIDRH